MVQRARLTGAGEQHQLERRIGDREVGVAISHLRRADTEQLGVEADRLLQIGDVQSQLHTRHDSSITLMLVDGLSVATHRRMSMQTTFLDTMIT
jgi:hypothetical protein